MQAGAQTGGDGAVTGTVQDATGAVVANATVTATNIATSIQTTRKTSEAGYYNIAPLIPGTYTITVAATGFEVFKQENLNIDAMHVSSFNATLKPGSESVTVTVTAAPPQMETADAVLGGTMENDVYMDLPLMVSGNQQRDITQFSNLLPGAQVNPGGRSSVIGGTAQRLGEVYLNGLPLTTSSQQGDNRPLFNLVPMESIDQIKVVTSSFSAEYQGAGLENYTLKSGTNGYHGTVADFVRNTIFDTWGFSAPWQKITNSKGVTGYQRDVGSKPVDHQNEFAASVGGPISIPHLFSGRDKLFFYASYDRTHSRSAANLTAATIPTKLMRTGDFSELLTANGGPGYLIYDPTTLTCPGASSTCTRKAFTGNVIPASKISPITQYMQKFLPDPINTAISSNYLGGIPGGYDNWLYSGRIDYDISAKQRLSMSVTGGNRANATYAVGSGAILPVPYLQGTKAIVAGHIADLSHTYTFSPHLVNQFKYGFVNFGGPPVQNPTQGIKEYEAQTAGITGLPLGQAAEEFPTQTFSGTNAQSQWSNGASSATYTSVSETYTMLDNLQWIKGRHAITAGFQMQWLENQASTADGLSTPLTLAWNTQETAAVVNSAYTTGSGYSYASYMMGAVNSSSDTLQTVSLLGGRYRPMAPYFQDDFKVTRNLTLNLGLRWDYIPTYHEAQDRWSYLDANVTNPATGNKGTLMFAGSHGGSGVSIGKSTPVDTYWKNWGPRLGFAYTLDDKTVIRGGFGVLYSHAGGTGGAGGAATGTGQNGFNTPISFTANSAGSTAGPVFYLNNNAAFAGANANYGGASYTLPTATGPTAAAQTLNVGNYVNSSGAAVAAGAAPGFPDPYLSGRAPEFEFYNFGFQRELTKDITISVNYAGSESHFIAGANSSSAGYMRGLQAGLVDPKYASALGAGGYGLNLMTQPATAANIAKAQAAFPGCCTVPYPGFQAAATLGTTVGKQATIAQMLKWMPQFSGTTDTWGNIANANYHALQISAVHRASHGLTLTVNYTYSKQMDDAGTQRTGFDVPAALTIDGKAWKKNRIDYGLSTLNQPQSLAIYGIYKFPFGKNGIGANNALVRYLLGGWDMSHIMTYTSGMPLTLSSGACASMVNQGVCMPDINPNYTGGRAGIRQNGKWGKGVTALTLGDSVSHSYVNGYINNTNPGYGAGNVPCGASTGPFCNAGIGKIGNAPRTGAFGLRAPSNFRLNSGIRRSFDITEKAKFIFAVDCQNVTNAVTFGINAGNLQIPTVVTTSTFGTLNYASGDSRDFQFSGRISF